MQCVWKFDHDQVAVFNWLRRVASDKQFLIPRYMKISDPADPAHMPQFLERLHEIDNALQSTAKKQKDRGRLLGKVRHKASILRGAAGDLSADCSKARNSDASGWPPANCSR